MLARSAMTETARLPVAADRIVQGGMTVDCVPRPGRPPIAVRYQSLARSHLPSVVQ
jgi:hypothetical protein